MRLQDGDRLWESSQADRAGEASERAQGAFEWNGCSHAAALEGYLPEGLCVFFSFFSLHVQQTLREKLVELQALMAEEKRLTRGEKTAPLPPPLLLKSADSELPLTLVSDRSRSAEQQQQQ